MSAIQQITAVTAMNLKSLPQRFTTSLVIVIGIAGVVAVLVSVLAMSTGMIKSIQGAGADDRAIVMRTGSTSEISSNLDVTSSVTVMDAPGVKRDGEGNAVASAETMTVVLLTKKDGSEVSVPMRGVGVNGFELRPEVNIIEGRKFEPAVYEFIVGKGAHAQYEGLDVGAEVNLRGATWKVVGVYESNGDTHEGELMANRDTLASATGRSARVSSVTVQLNGADAFDTFKDALTTNPTLSVDVMRESEYFAQQSEAVGPLLNIIAYVVGGIMAVGAIFAALNTMYSAVSNRMVEIATLRALGFGSTPIIFSILMEALLLALIGGTIGAFLGWLFFNGHTVSTIAGSIALESKVFSLYVSPSLMVLGIIWALVIGMLGGLFPAIRAARLPIATALRSS